MSTHQFLKHEYLIQATRRYGKCIQLQFSLLAKSNSEWKQKYP